jgi:LDH2 family malate/lactate/ureidoglycolate dehydrogenase
MADGTETVAKCLVQADLRGGGTDGPMRLRGYLNRVRLRLCTKPDLFARRDESTKRMDGLVDKVQAAPTAEDFTDVLMAGSRKPP